MRILLWTLALILIHQTGTASPRFRLHLFSEPTSLFPADQKSSGGGYLLSQLSCPLLRWNNSEAISSAGKCRFTQKTKVECDLDPSLTFESGEKVEAKHYVQAFEVFLNPKKPSARADLLFSVKNAQAYLKGEKKFSEVGLSANGSKLVFELEKADPEFLLTLTNPLLTAIHPSRSSKTSIASCGPYQIQNWERGRKIVLKARNYPGALNNRPEIEVLFILEDSLALQAYQKNELDLLRRLPTVYLKQWEKSSELIKADQIRFDYLALSELHRDPHLAKALAQGIDFEEWRKLYSAKPSPGCFGIPERWTDGPICWKFNPTEAKSELAKIKDPAQLKKLRLFYSKQGGDDHDRTMEFLQAQWKKNLGLDVKIEAQENKIFLETLRSRKAPFFRKGLNPERPSCLAVMETFLPKAPENYLDINSSELNSAIEKIAHGDAKACRQAALVLKDTSFLIPTGPIYFSMLLKPGWKGVFLNELNTLDLTQLQFMKN